MNYWVARGGQQFGPYALPDVRRMVTEGRIALTDLGWKEGMASWAPLAQVLPAEAPPAPAQAPLPPPPAPAYAQPAYAQPAYAQPAYGVAPAVAAAPFATPGGFVPPSLHWAVVFILAMVTFGIFGIVWIFVQANFVKRIDPRNPSRMLFIVAFLLELFYIGLMVVVVAAAASGMRSALYVGTAGPVIILVAAVCALVGIFKMRSSLVNYYNTVEPIQLRLSGVMTFFFNIYYFQYHFTRIAEWKKTGRLTPQ